MRLKAGLQLRWRDDALTSGGGFDAILVAVLGGWSSSSNNAVRRPVPGGRDHEVDVDLGSGDRLQRFLDEPGETISSQSLASLLGTPIRKVPPSAGERPTCSSATCRRSVWRAETAAPPGPVTRSDPGSTRHLPFPHPPQRCGSVQPPGGPNRGQPAKPVDNLGSTEPSSPGRDLARPATPRSRRRRPRIQPELLEHRAPPPRCLWKRADRISTGWRGLPVRNPLSGLIPKYGSGAIGLSVAYLYDA